MSSEVVSYPSVLNLNSFLSVGFSPSACKHDKDPTPNLLFQFFSLFFAKLHRKCFSGAVCISWLSISASAHHFSPNTQSKLFLISNLVTYYFLEPMENSLSSFYGLPFLNLCAVVYFFPLWKSLPHWFARHHILLVPLNSTF